MLKPTLQPGQPGFSEEQNTSLCWTRIRQMMTQCRNILRDGPVENRDKFWKSDSYRLVECKDTISGKITIVQIDIAGVRCDPISRYQVFHGWDRRTETVKETQLQKRYTVYNPTVYISGYLPFHTCTPLICKASLPKVWIQMDGWAQVSSHATRGWKKDPEY